MCAKISHCPECRDLADLFLSGVEGCTEKDVDKLAKAIEDLCSDAQDEIEIRERTRTRA